MRGAGREDRFGDEFLGRGLLSWGSRRVGAARRLTLVHLAALTTLLSALAIFPPSLRRARADMMDTVLNDFAGSDLAAKNGPMVKIGPELILLFEENRGSRSAAASASSNPLLAIIGDKVVVDVVAADDGSALESELRGLGMDVGGRAGRIVSGALPIDALAAVAASPSVQFAQPATAHTTIGQATSQGVSAMGADRLSSFTVGGQRIDGRGVTVGVLSDSFDCLGGAAADLASNDLSPVTVLHEFSPCADGSDEGRGMLQIVHDVAPAAALQYSTAYLGQATMANHILELAAAGSDVLVDDVFYFAEPFFQDGVIAQAVDTVVAQGIPYFPGAGNFGRGAYESSFRTGSALAPGLLTSVTPTVPFFFGGDAHDFDSGPGIDILQRITIPANSGAVLILQWDQPFFSVSGPPGAVTDLDVYLLDPSAFIVAGSVVNNIGGDAVEVFGFANSSATTAENHILITRRAGPIPSFMKYILIATGGGGAGTFEGTTEFATNSGTIFGHFNSGSGETVGCAPYFSTPAFGVSPPLLEPYSSAGTTPIFFTTTGMPTVDPRADKPEIVAPDGGDTTFFGSDDIDGTGFPNFFGCSAAAPHAAGVAALMRQVSPSSSPATIYATLEATAIDMGPPGFDNDSGFGLVQAYAAVCALAECRALAPAPMLSWPALLVLLSALAGVGWRITRRRPIKADSRTRVT